MPSQFFGLYIAGSGLRAAQAGLNTSTNNMANAQTAGYSRQQVVQEASDALRTFTTYGCAGAGVDTIAIERVRDHFYDVKYWNNSASLGRYTAQQYYMKTMEDYFSDDGITGFSTLFGKMSAALQDAKDASDDVNRKKAFISSISALTEYFNSTHGNLQKMQNDLNQEIKQTADQINAIGEKVATLNKQINVIEMSGTTANELRDQREKLIDDLSLLVDVKVEEIPVYDLNDPTRLTGATRYIVNIAGGQNLITGNEYNSLNCIARQSYEKVNQTDIDGLYDIEWSNGNNFGLGSGVMSGKLKGLAEMRDGNNGSFFKGQVREIGSTIVKDENGNDKYTSTVTIAVTGDMTDMKLCGLSDTGGRVMIGGREFYYSSWTYDEQNKQYTFTMDNDKCDEPVSQAQVGKEAEVGKAVNYQGIPYYMTQMNAWLRGFAEKVNDIFTGGFDINGDPGCIMFSGEKIAGGQYVAEDLKAGEGNGFYELTAGNVTVFAALIDDASRLGSKVAQNDGVSEYSPMDEMVTLLTSKEKFEFRNGSAADFLTMIIGDVTMNAGNANTFQKTYTGLSATIESQRISISGVDEDEEGVNLVKFQRAYELAAKMVQTLSEVYDRLILQTGV